MSALPERIALGAKVCEFCRKEVTSPVSVSPQASFASTPHVSAPTDSQKGALLEQHTPTLVTEGIARASPGGYNETITDDSSVSLESNRIWLWIDRLLPAGTIGLVQIIFGFGTSLGRVWEFLGPDFKIFALLCPLAAATICAIVSDRSKSRLAIRALAILSFTTPLIVFSSGPASGRSGLSASLPRAVQMFYGAPFVLAAGLALAIVTLPRRSQTGTARR